MRAQVASEGEALAAPFDAVLHNLFQDRPDAPAREAGLSAGGAPGREARAERRRKL